MRLNATRLGSIASSRSFGDQLDDLAGQVPNLDLNFAQNKSLIDDYSGTTLVTFTRASSGTFVGSDGLIQTAVTDAPRFDHNPTTGESLGLLVEEARTNSVRNNTMVGAVAGTPGTLPTNWSVFTLLTGLTREIVGTGTENGITYIDIKLSGTPSAAGSYFISTDTSTQAAAANGQTWTCSAYFKLQAGTTTGLSGFSINVSPRDSLGNTVGNVSTAFTPTTGALIAQRVSSTITNNSALTAYQLQFIQINLSGVAIDITLRIGLPQLELGAFATSVIPTTTAAATRAADVASIGSSAFTSFYNQSENTTFIDTTSVGSNTGFTFVISDGTDNNRNGQFKNGSDVISRLVLAGAQNNAGSISYTPPQLRVRSLVSAQAGSTIMCVNGTLGSASTQSPLPTVDRITIGSGALGTNFLGGTIRRLCFWPIRLPNSTLQAITG